MTATTLRPELLCPAGTLKSMRYAFAYGADAVYAGQPRYSLRVRNNEFDHANLALGIQEAHDLGKRFYVVVNIAPHNAKLKTFLKDLEPVVAMGPDALIMSDPGLIMLVRENFPDMPIHLSVQANAVNWATVKFRQQMGLTRVILSRELSLDEIEEIRRQVKDRVDSVKLALDGIQLRPNGEIIAAGDGNVSVRLDADRVLVTPTGFHKGFIREDDLIGIMPSSNATADGARSIRALSAHMCRNAAAVEGPVPLASASPLASPVHALVFF